MKICQKGLTLKRKISQADERRKEINDVAENVENLLLLETGKNDLIPKGLERNMSRGKSVGRKGM